jgi:predicted nucleic acid-binding protein
MRRQDLATCDVVLHEVRFGLAANPVIAAKLGVIYEALFDSLTILPTEQEVWSRAASIRANHVEGIQVEDWSIVAVTGASSDVLPIASL